MVVTVVAVAVMALGLPVLASIADALSTTSLWSEGEMFSEALLVLVKDNLFNLKVIISNAIVIVALRIFSAIGHIGVVISIINIVLLLLVDWLLLGALGNVQKASKCLESLGRHSGSFSSLGWAAASSRRSTSGRQTSLSAGNRITAAASRSRRFTGSRSGCFSGLNMIAPAARYVVHGDSGSPGTGLQRAIDISVTKAAQTLHLAVQHSIIGRQDLGTLSVVASTTMTMSVTLAPASIMATRLHNGTVSHLTKHIAARLIVGNLIDGSARRRVPRGQD